MGLTWLKRRFHRFRMVEAEFKRPDEGRKDATTPLRRVNTHWLLEKAQHGEMNAEEFVKLSKEHGKELRESPMNTDLRKVHDPP